MSFVDVYVPESAEEREFFKLILAHQHEYWAEKLQRVAAHREVRAERLAAQAFAPDGHYAYMFDGDGWPRLTPHASECFDEDGDWISDRVRIRAAVRKV